MTAPAAEHAAAIVEAINSRDPERIAKHVDESSKVVTGRSAHTGRDAVTRWARKEYDHLVKRYAIDEFRIGRDAVLALGAVQYAWIQGGEVADSSPIALRIELDGERLRTLELHDDTAAALAAFEA